LGMGNGKAVLEIGFEKANASNVSVGGHQRPWAWRTAKRY